VSKPGPALSARQFIEKISALATPTEREKNQRYFKEKMLAIKLGVGFATIFKLASLQTWISK
jgi:hypothetical protein